jgi:hypothetical protein
LISVSAEFLFLCLGEPYIHAHFTVIEEIHVRTEITGNIFSGMIGTTQRVEGTNTDC